MFCGRRVARHAQEPLGLLCKRRLIRTRGKLGQKTPCINAGARVSPKKKAYLLSLFNFTLQIPDWQTPPGGCKWIKKAVGRAGDSPFSERAMLGVKKKQEEVVERKEKLQTMNSEMN